MPGLLYFVRRAIEDGLEHLTEPVVLLMLGQIAVTRQALECAPNPLLSVEFVVIVPNRDSLKKLY